MVESVGRKLQQARLARKLEIEDVAERTKIRPDRVIDLEADEYSHFPNLTYAKSFLAKYARFLDLNIQEELDKFQIPPAISMGDYQYLSSFRAQTHGQQLGWMQRIQPKGFRVPPAVVIVLVLVVLVGVPVVSYLALNIPRVAGTNFEDATGKGNQLTMEPAKTGGAAAAASGSDSVKSLSEQSSAAKSAAVAAPQGSQPQGVTSDATPPEKKLEVRVLRRTYVKVTTDQQGTQPVFEGFAAPESRPIVVEGKRFWVHALDKGAVEVREDGQLVPGNSGDIVID